MKVETKLEERMYCNGQYYPLQVLRDELRKANVPVKDLGAKPQANPFLGGPQLSVSRVIIVSIPVAYCYEETLLVT